MAGAAPQEVENLPEADLLEFPGSWNIGDDHPKWIDPFQLEELASPKTNQQDRAKFKGNRRDEPKSHEGDDRTPTKQVLPDSVRPGGGVTP
jgi:hypothetical protein